MAFWPTPELELCAGRLGLTPEALLRAHSNGALDGLCRDLRKEYHRQSLLCHPDRISKSEISEGFRELSHAHTVLSEYVRSFQPQPKTSITSQVYITSKEAKGFTANWWDK